MLKLLRRALCIQALRRAQSMLEIYCAVLRRCKSLIGPRVLYGANRELPWVKLWWWSSLTVYLQPTKSNQLGVTFNFCGFSYKDKFGGIFEDFFFLSINSLKKHEWKDLKKKQVSGYFCWRVHAEHSLMKKCLLMSKKNSILVRTASME